MYNTEVVCIYNDLSSYQEMILRILGTNLDGLATQIQVLYDQLKDHEKINILIQKINGPWMTPDLAFCVLFSYEYFEYTHRFICELLNDQPLTAYDTLYGLL
jgi:hypothetical protein